MDSTAMSAISHEFANLGLRTARFEFEYMAARRTSVSKRPPPRADRLTQEYLAAVDALASATPVIIGGKSMGGRVASMVADELRQQQRICGLLCIGYPFHPIGKPDQLRTRHLETITTPTLIAQGTRDPFGTRDEVAGYALSSTVELLWLEDGDHDLRPRKAISGFTAAQHLRTLATAVLAWSSELT